jgi:hypothetical protein
MDIKQTGKSKLGLWIVVGLILAGGAAYLFQAKKDAGHGTNSQPGTQPAGEERLAGSVPGQADTSAPAQGGQAQNAQTSMRGESAAVTPSGALVPSGAQTGLAGGQTVYTPGLAAGAAAGGAGRVEVGAMGASQGAVGISVGQVAMVQHGDGQAPTGVAGQTAGAVGASGTTGGASAPTLSQAELEIRKQLAAQQAALKTAGCVLVTYQPKQTGRDGAHRYARNKLALTEEARGNKSLCVRIDGTPVKFSYSSAKKEEVVIGPVQKANSVVTVRYCRGSLQCTESCVVPKDEFMDALAGDDSENAGVATAQWDPKSKGASAEEAAADKELEAMEDALSEDRKQSVFSSWLAERQSPACEGKTEQKQSVQGRKTASAK